MAKIIYLKLKEAQLNLKITCTHYENCSAPLCPNKSDEQNSNSIWYPDEEICLKRKGLPAWVKQQRKIAQKAKPENCGYYFTLDMLKVPFRVTRSVKGLDPDMPLEKEERQLKSWFKRNKGIKGRNFSKEQREQKKERVALARLAKQQKMEQAIEATV